MAVDDGAVLEDDRVMDEFVVVFVGFDAEKGQGAEKGDALVKSYSARIRPSSATPSASTTVTLERISTMVLVMPSQILSQ